MSQARESSSTVPVSGRIRSFNKHVLNRLTLRLARASFGLFVIVRHTGRRSGKTYETPILAIKRPDSFIVALTYGPQVDWYRNVVAANGCIFIWHQHEYIINGLQPLDIETAMPYFPALFHPILRLTHTEDFVSMKIQPAP